jgi:hypothetical protein
MVMTAKAAKRDSNTLTEPRSVLAEPLNDSQGIEL